MSIYARVAIHRTQFPDRVRQDLVESLRTRRLNHKFLYDSVKQTQKWLNLHQAYSPSRTDPDCARVYESAFQGAAGTVGGRPVLLVGLGCGGGQKDSRLLRLLREGGAEVWYTPVDVSTSMALVAREAALEVIPEANCAPLVCDLAGVEDWSALLAGEGFGPTQRWSLRIHRSSELSPAPGVRNADPPQPLAKPTVFRGPAVQRLVTFFGMIPNFEPHFVMPQLAGMVRRGDALLLSANLAPGEDYASGVRQVIPLYDNPLTREWLMAALQDFGVEPGDGSLEFRVEEEPAGGGLQRIAAYFCFGRARQLQVEEQRFDFGLGQTIRLFFSYRHTPERVTALLGKLGLSELGRWITRSGEEGVFLFGRG